MDTFGLSFSPTQQNSNTQNPNNQSPTAGGSGSPIQDAIKVLSLRIPHITGPGGIAPPGLLNSAGGAGMPQGGAGGLEEFLRRLFGGQGIPGMGAAPPPNVIPGVGGGPGENPLPSPPGGFNPSPAPPPPSGPPMGGANPAQFGPRLGRGIGHGIGMGGSSPIR